MLNIRLYLATVAVLSLAGYGWGLWQHKTGWREGRTALLAEQSEAAEKLRQENAQRQQVEDTKAAAAAEEQGEAKTVTITREVVKYVQTPGRNVYRFDDRRLRIKADAVANANFASGFDAPPLPVGNAGK